MRIARDATAWLVLAAMLFPAPWVPAVQAQVRRCTGSDGTLVYTDRKCEDIGATELAYTPRVGGSGYGSAYRGCARSVEDLAFLVGDAIHASDVNRLAGLYDWTGTSTANGYRLMTRLEAIAKRPLVDVQPAYSGGDPYGYGDIVEFDENGAIVQRAASRRRLVGMRIEQTLANGSTPSRTMFGLRKHLGCWWVRL